jgi:hypothetical protein
MHLANSRFNQLCFCIFFCINKTCGNIVCYLNKDTTMARGARITPKHLIICIRQTQNLTRCVSLSFFASTKHVEILFAISIRIQARGARTPPKYIIICIRQTQNSTSCVYIFIASTKHVEILFSISIRILQWLEELGHPLSTL